MSSVKLDIEGRAWCIRSEAAMIIWVPSEGLEICELKVKISIQMILPADTMHLQASLHRRPHLRVILRHTGLQNAGV